MIFLTLLKWIAAYLSGSVGVLSEALHSFLDLISVSISYFTIRIAGKPADEDHPFGHGKIETLSSLFESLLLIMAAFLIFYEGVNHFFHPQLIYYEGFAIFSIFFSIIVSFFVFRHNRFIADLTQSSAIHVNALHFFSDVIASTGVLIALVMMRWTHWLWIDPLIAFLVAFYMSVTAGKQVYQALSELVDRQLPESEIIRIRALLHADSKMIEVHDLRTRKSGSVRHIDFHLVVCGKMSVDASHSLCDELELRISSEFPGSSTTIHVEPCEKEKTHCYLTCFYYKTNHLVDKIKEK